MIFFTIAIVSMILGLITNTAEEVISYNNRHVMHINKDILDVFNWLTLVDMISDICISSLIIFYLWAS